MKIFYLFAFLVIISCSINEKKQYQVSKKVTISGKVLNFDSEKNEVDLYVNRLGLSQEHINSQLDSMGNFSASFESYIPTDIWLRYKTNFLVLTHPGDSIYVEFDGKPKQRPAILKTIKYSGNAAKTNQDAAVFQQMYFSNALYTNWDAKQKAKKDYEVDEYMQYLDTLKQKNNELYEKFILDVGPNKETKVWVLTYIEQDYYDALSFYPMDHQRANKLSRDDWDVPISYYEPLLARLPITESMLISGNALSSFINRYHYNYAMVNLQTEEAFQKVLKERESLANPLEIFDSLTVYGVIKHTHDTLLRQMVLTELFRQRFDKFEIDLFEKYKNVVDSYIQEPFLHEPLLEMYYHQKQRLENPQIASNAMLKKVVNSSAKQIMDSIMSFNKEKVIYLDCWATWCAPCKGEFPNSKNLMKQMEGKEVSFVFMCLDSEEKVWKATLAEFQLGGQHYFLTKEQSIGIRKAFDVQGIPHYFLIDQKGTIVEKSSHLRPNIVKEKIEKLLNK